MHPKFSCFLDKAQNVWMPKHNFSLYSTSLGRPISTYSWELICSAASLRVRRRAAPTDSRCRSSSLIVKLTCRYEAQRDNDHCPAPCCVPGTARILKGAVSIPFVLKLIKSQTQPDGGEGYSGMATGYPATVPGKEAAQLRQGTANARGDEQEPS